MKNKLDINKLVFQRLIGEISEEDDKSLQEWINSSDAHRKSYEHLVSGNNIYAQYHIYEDIDAQKAWIKFKKKYTPAKSIYPSIMKYAAILMLPIVGLSIWLMLQNLNTKPKLSKEAHKAMIKSEELGKSQAMLILASGEKVQLNSALDDKHGNDDDLIMAQSLAPASESSEDNKLVTQNDSEYWLTFEDGTVVHLNYNTSLSYPVHFGENDRTVYLDGEAYFQVAKDSKRPFRVLTSSGVVKEYGTSFNVNTKAETGIEVVLVEGSISLTPHNGRENMLAPGEMATIQSTGKVTVNKVDVEPYVAWNNGSFNFNNYTLERIMKVLSQWYGKEVRFESEDIKYMHFTGDIDKYGTIQPFLNAIRSMTGLDVQMHSNVIEINKP